MLTRARAFYRPSAKTGRTGAVARLVRGEVERLWELRDPKGLYAHCRCAVTH